jgi:STE24 endopeptidase
MNTYAIIILVTLLAEYFLSLVADVLNMNTLGRGIPPEFEGVIDAEAYQKSQSYTRVRTNFGILTSSVSLVMTLAFWLYGGFNWLDIIVRSWQFGVLWSGLLYIGILVFVRSILSLPFSIYSTFVIEERFGFNKTTPKTFVLDLLKALILGIILGGPLLVGILAFFEYAGSLAWLYCWIVATVFMLVVQFVAPTWIMPIFNKFTSLEEGELKNAIMSYASSVKFSLKDVFVMDGSKRSSKSNAFFTGFGKNKRIALFDTLIRQHTIPELVAVLAHEIGHYKKRHILQGMVISIAHMGVMFYLLSLFVSEQGLFDAFFMEHVSMYAGMIFFGMLFTPIEFVLSYLMHILSRRNEFQADRYSAETYRHPAAMVDALKKLSVHNLSHLTPHPFYVALNYSHPPVVERIRALKQQ